jgi:chitosanase
MQKIIQFIRRSPLEISAAVLSAFAVVISGYTFLVTRAANTYAFADASTAAVANGAQVLSDSTAIGQKAITFKSAGTPPPATPPPTSSADLSDPKKKEIAMQLVSSAENSSLDWKSQYKYIEDIKDGRGYTGGIIGFTSGTHDMLELVQYYAKISPNNILAKYIPALQKVDGSASHTGLDPNYTKDWVTAAADPLFQQAQNDERDRTYFNPAVAQGKTDGLHALGQFIYYDALVMHGPGDDPVSFGGIRATALKKAKTPAQGGDETIYLNAFLDARKAAMLTEAAHDDTDRVDTEQRVFLKAGNLNLNTPLSWTVYGDSYTIK